MSGGTSVRQPWLRSCATLAATCSSFVVTAPPSPVVTIFRGWKLRQPATPSPPHARPRYFAPSAPAASSSSGTAGSSGNGSGRPNRCTPSSSFVRGPTSSFDGSTFIVSGSTSTSTGVRPASATTFAVAGKVYAGTSTSSPGCRSSASTARWSAAVPEVTASAYWTSHSRAISASNSPTFGPIVSIPLSNTSATSASSSSPTSGSPRRTLGRPTLTQY